MPARLSHLIIPKVLLGAAFCLLCAPLPGFVQPAQSGSAQAGTATSGPGRLVTPEDRERAERAQPAPGWGFDAQAPTDEEKARAARLGHERPRRLISDYLERLQPPQG